MATVDDNDGKCFRFKWCIKQMQNFHLNFVLLVMGKWNEMIKKNVNGLVFHWAPLFKKKVILNKNDDDDDGDIWLKKHDKIFEVGEYACLCEYGCVCVCVWLYWMNELVGVCVCVYLFGWCATIINGFVSWRRRKKIPDKTFTEVYFTSMEI